MTTTYEVAQTVLGATPNIDAVRRKVEPLCRQVLLNHEAAVQFILTLFCDIFHVWDDLVDRDWDVSDEEIHAAFWGALVTLPSNLFYVQHRTTLHPLMVTAMLNWQTATRLEREQEPHDTQIAFGLRTSYFDILTTAALLVGGREWARRVGPSLHRFVSAQESYADYMANLAREATARQTQTAPPTATRAEG